MKESKLATFIRHCLFLLPATAVTAQEANDLVAEEDVVGIEVIEVTSEKRVSTLQETPIAISAFNASELARQDIEEAADIQFSIPNAMFTDRGTFNIRGVGNNAISATAESGTGVHINGVYLTAPSASNEFYDLQSIEVLRGPQGTLYGRNTTAGVVNVITHRPSDALEGYLTTEFGNFNSLRTVGALNIPLSETVLQRFAFNTVKRDGFTENIATGEDIDGRDQYSIRSTTYFELGDNTDATLFAQYFEEDSDRSLRRGVRCISDPILGCSADEVGHEFVNSDYVDGNLRNTLLGVLAGINGVPDPFKGVFFPSFNNVAGMVVGNINSDFYNVNPDGTRKINPQDPRQVNLDNTPIAYADDLVVSLELNHEIASGTFTSVTAYHERSAEGQRDFDNANGSNAFIRPVSYVFNDSTVLQGTTGFEPVQTFDLSSEQWSQELRFVSQLDGKLNYTAGLYWLNYKAESRVVTYVPYLSMLGDLLDLPDYTHGFDTTTPEAETTSWAVFGETYYDLTDNLKMTAGVRFSNEDKSQVSQTVSPLNFIGGITALLADPTNYLDATTFISKRNALVDSVENTFERIENDWQETTGKLGLSYNLQSDATDETLLFATLAKGYKAGGLNPGGATKTAFDAEYINSVEFGTKNTLLDRSLQANATFFYYDYEGLQLGALETNGSGAAITDNTDAKVKGAEFEFVAMPTADLLINLNLSFLDSEVTGEFATPDGAQPSTAGLVDVRGNALPYAPEKSLQLGIQYSHELGDDWEVSYFAQTYWQDDFYARIYNISTDVVDSWQQTDLTISFRDVYDTWEIEAFIKNIDDADSMTGLTVENRLVGRFRLPAILDPRQYGVRVTYRFE